MKMLKNFSPTTAYKPTSFQFRLGRPELWIGIIVTAIGLSIFQDYLYSRVQNTGFYLSESLLYNGIWAFLLPIALLQVSLLKRLTFKRKLVEYVFSIALSGVLTILHLLLFSAFFVMVSYFVFSPTHRFSQIFNAAFSNQLYILALLYTFIPFVYRMVKSISPAKEKTIEHREHLNVKTGLKTISLSVASIEFISTEKPYSVINANGRTFLDNRTLKELESMLTQAHFARVHRSVIINKHMVKELKSRQNGDYDCILQSGQAVRLSRHYKANWQDLLQ